MTKLALLTFLLTTLTFADVITLQPGESVTLGPVSEKVTLHCQSEGNSPLVDKFCVCKDLGPQYMVNLEKLFIYGAGVKESVLLGRYRTAQECSDALKESEACR
jgi:hypothetical protein